MVTVWTVMIRVEHILMIIRVIVTVDMNLFQWTALSEMENLPKLAKTSMIAHFHCWRIVEA
jgi:hypothetical protein